MIKSTVHSHSVFCDGKNTLAEMAAAAYDSGLKCIGFSSHSYTEHDDFGMKYSLMAEYVEEIQRLKTVYQGKMDVLCGLELDAITVKIPESERLDYIIGSLHSVRGNGDAYYCVDGNIKRFEENIKVGFDASFEKMYEAYYEQFAEFICNACPDIAGHFDLVTKYNERYGYFDAESPRYKIAALTALDVALEQGTVIEVNTGAMTRGYRTKPYPAEFLLKRILERNGRVIITTDTHSASTLTSYADEAEEYLRSAGFSSVWELGNKGFYERAL